MLQIFLSLRLLGFFSLVHRITDGTIMNTTLYLSEYTLVTRHHSSLLDQLVYYKGKSFCALLIFVQKTANILQEPDDDVFVNRLELFYAFAD